MASPSAPPAPYGTPHPTDAHGGGMMPASRPTGVTVIAVLYIIGAVFMGIAALIAFAAGAFVGAAGVGTGEGALGMLGFLGAAAGLALLVLAGLYAATAFGLFKQKRWAWYVALVVAGLQVLMGLLSLISLDIFSALFSLAIGGFVIWYLLSPGVQAWFGTSVNTPWKYKGNTSF